MVFELQAFQDEYLWRFHFRISHLTTVISKIDYSDVFATCSSWIKQHISPPNLAMPHVYDMEAL